MLQVRTRRFRAGVLLKSCTELGGELPSDPKLFEIQAWHWKVGVILSYLDWGLVQASSALVLPNQAGLVTWGR